MKAPETKKTVVKDSQQPPRDNKPATGKSSWTTAMQGVRRPSAPNAQPESGARAGERVERDADEGALGEATEKGNNLGRHGHGEYHPGDDDPKIGNSGDDGRKDLTLETIPSRRHGSVATPKSSVGELRQPDPHPESVPFRDKGEGFTAGHSDEAGDGESRPSCGGVNRFGKENVTAESPSTGDRGISSRGMRAFPRDEVRKARVSMEDAVSANSWSLPDTEGALQEHRALLERLDGDSFDHLAAWRSDGRDTGTDSPQSRVESYDLDGDKASERRRIVESASRPLSGFPCPVISKD